MCSFYTFRFYCTISTISAFFSFFGRFCWSVFSYSALSTPYLTYVCLRVPAFFWLLPLPGLSLCILWAQLQAGRTVCHWESLMSPLLCLPMWRNVCAGEWACERAQGEWWWGESHRGREWETKEWGMRGAVLPAALAAQILTAGFWEPMLLLWDKPKLWRQPGSVVCGQAVCCCRKHGCI